MIKLVNHKGQRVKYCAISCTDWGTAVFFLLPSHVQVLMIGDDLLNDVGGAQHCGMKGVQVRTGKYRSVLS